MIAFYIVGLSTKTLRNVLFVDSIDSIIEKTAVIMRTAIEEKANLLMPHTSETLIHKMLNLPLI
jgi:hypothetical protein